MLLLAEQFNAYASDYFRIEADIETISGNRLARVYWIDIKPGVFQDAFNNEHCNLYMMITYWQPVTKDQHLRQHL